MLEIPLIGNISSPFMVAGVAGSRVISTRIIEALVIAGLTTIMSTIWAIPKITERMDNQAVQIAELRAAMLASIEKNDLYQRDRRQLRDAEQKENLQRLRALELKMAEKK